MKKIGVLNQPISSVISGMGHTDTLVIADAGLPIPDGTKRIDLALTAGIPSFLDTLRVVLDELEVEQVVIAEEMLSVNPELHNAMRTLLGEVPIHTVSHEAFKAQTGSARAVVRTGECSPYANVILASGVVF